MNNNSINIEEILNLLPYRYPFLLIDRVLNFEKNKFLYAVKNVSFNEPFFQGHFPGKPIFPGVLILEAIAQASSILAFQDIKKLKFGKFYYFSGIDKARFKYPVQPGDQIIFEIIFIKKKCNLTYFKGIAKVDKRIVCEAIIMCAKK